MPRNILFIVNPNAGKRVSEHIISYIKEEIPESMRYMIIVWKEKDQFEEISSLLRTGHYTDAVAVGGDGTVNQVAKTILGTDIALGIVPIGSGNGLARTLGLSMDIKTAIKQIVEGRKVMMDYGLANNIPFFCTSGVGFDAHIGYLFATSVKRGLQSYVKISVGEFFKYKAKNYRLELNGQTFERKAFLITVANAGQYGNDFYIAPQASIQDGMFHVALIKPVTLLSAIGIVAKVLKRKAHLSSSIETFVTNKLRIIREEPASIHFDGEPISQGNEVVYENKHQAITVIVGDKFKAA